MRVPILPPPGLVSDSTDYAAPGVWSSCSNVRFFHGVPEAIGGEYDITTGVGETYSNASKLFAYKVSDALNVAMATDTKLWRLRTNVSWARVDITPAAGWSATDRASFAMFGDVLLAVPHTTAPASSGTLFASTAGAQAVSVAAAPDNINCMIVTPSRQVMALGCNEEVSTTYNGRCIRWSDIEDYTDWTTSSSNNAGEYILPGQDDIIGARLVGDHIVIWTKGALWFGQFIGQPGQTFIFNRIDNKGLLARDCHAELQGTVYWMAQDFSVYAWRPGAVPTKIECPCQIAVLSDMGVTNATGDYLSLSGKLHASANAVRGEIWFFYADSTILTTGSANKYLAYCVNESTQRPVWFRGSLLAGAVLSDPLLALANNSFDSQFIAIEYGANKALRAIDKTSVASGALTYPSWSIQSSFYYLDEGQRRVQIQRYVVDTHTSPIDFRLTVQMRPYPEEGATSYGPFTISGVSRYDFRASGRLASVKFESPATSTKWRLGKPVFEVVALGNR